MGKNITDQFLISRNFQDSDSFAYTDNLNQYVYYDDNDNEVIIYKKEIPYRMENENVSLDRKSTRLNSSHVALTRIPSSA